MTEYSLEVKTRELTGRKAQEVRDAAEIPAVIYGGKEHYIIQMPAVKFVKLYEKAGESNIIELTIDGKTKVPVLVKDIQRHPTTYDIIHADFYEFDMNKEINAMVPLVYEGEAPAVKKGGVVIQNLDEVEVRCLPNNLIHEIIVDQTVLNEIEDNIHVGDLQVPENVKIVTSEDILVVKVAEKQTETEPEEGLSEQEAVAAVGVEGAKAEGEESGAEK